LSSSLSNDDINDNDNDSVDLYLGEESDHDKVIKNACAAYSANYNNNNNSKKTGNKDDNDEDLLDSILDDDDLVKLFSELKD